MSGGPVSSLLGGAFRYWNVRQATMANNLANASTDGFRGERVFARLLEDGRTPVAESRTDLRTGALSKTDNPLDVALEGRGFLAVETDAGVRWTRGGALGVDESGRLVDGSGNPVLGEGGVLQVPEGEISIDPTGQIVVDGASVGRLRVDRLPDGVDPVREGDTHFRAPEGESMEGDRDTRILQGQVEQSNVDPVSALVEMVEVQRAYSSLERSARTLDEMMDTISNRLSRVD